MPELEKAVSSYALDDYYQRRPIACFCPARPANAFDLEQEKPETRDKYGRTTFLVAKVRCWPAAWWKPETRFVCKLNWLHRWRTAIPR